MEPLYVMKDSRRRADPALAIPHDEEREAVVQALCLHYANDHLSTDTLEERLTRAYRALSSAELEELLADLRPLPVKKQDAGRTPALVPSNSVPARGFLAAIMGGQERKGQWIVPRHLKMFAFWGGLDIDLREARFAPGVTELEITAIMGGAEITVPPGVRVEVIGTAIMGGYVTSAGDAGALGPDAPVLRVSGLVLMGGVEIKHKEPSKKVLKKFQRAYDSVRRLPSAFAPAGDDD